MEAEKRDPGNEVALWLELHLLCSIQATVT